MTTDAALSSELFESFLLDSWDTFAQLETAILDLREDFNPDTLKRLAVLSHRVRGTTALYGFTQMSRLAELAERLLDLRPRLNDEQREGLIAFLERLLVCLRSALERVSVQQGEGELGLEFAQIGGTALLKNLLGSNPGAFAREAKGPAETATGDLNAVLSGFWREHADVWSYFAPEAREHLETMRAVLESGVLDSGGSDAEALTQLFRAAHTLKGSAYMVGLSPLGDLGHHMEDVMDAARGGRVAYGDLTQTLGEGVDLGERMLRAAEGEAGDLTAVTRHTRRKLAALLGDTLPDGESAPAAPKPSEAAPATPEARTSVRVSTEKLDALMDGVGELIVARGRMGFQLGQLANVARLLDRAQERLSRAARDFEDKYLNPLLSSTDQVRAGEVSVGGVSVTGVSATVREVFDELEFDSYSDLNIVARSVTELAADLGELHGQLERQLTALRDEDETLTKLTRALRGEVARARRVPFGQALTRLKRWARTRDGAKPFALDFGGETIEVDTFVLEAVVDPLLHLVNNALIHGLEDPETRLASGKPREGRIGVRAVQRGAFLEVEVQDDGAGIDTARVRERARGLLPDEDLARLTPEEVAGLIFLPGLSTASEVSAEAGRGVGMDVVASNLRRLGGKVLTRSERGAGTTFTLRVPLTQQISEVLLLRVGKHLAGFPITLVRALRSLNAQSVNVTEGAEHVEVEGETLRLYRLGELWGEAPGPDLIGTGLIGAGQQLSVAVVQTGAGRVAVAVDAFLGLEEVAVRPSGGLLSGLPYLGGTALSGAGQIVLLLDPQGIEGLASGARPTVLMAGAARPRRAGRLLLVDDSLSVRRIVARMLERAGYTVVTAPDGYEALELLRDDHDFDAVLTDLEMPRVSGYELLEELRRRRETAGLPTLVMTTRAGEKHQQLASTLGATAYFSKPIDEARLVRRLAELTAKGRR